MAGETIFRLHPDFGLPRTAFECFCRTAQRASRGLAGLVFIGARLQPVSVGAVFVQLRTLFGDGINAGVFHDYATTRFAENEVDVSGAYLRSSTAQ